MSPNEAEQKECRRIARQIWFEQPFLTHDEMVKKDEIKFLAFKGRQYSREELLMWIRPYITPLEEFDYYKAKKLWPIEDAVALWRDMNPFILSQDSRTRNATWWNTEFTSDLRESFNVLLEKVKIDIYMGNLNSTKADNRYLVSPQDFLEWASKNTDGPSGGGPKAFFHDLQRSWSKDDGSSVCQSTFGTDQRDHLVSTNKNDQDLNIPSKITATEQSEAPAVPVQPAEESIRDRRAKYDMTKARGCRELILRNWDKIEKLHGDIPDRRQVLRIIERNVGNFETPPSLAAVGNTLSILRKEKLIPGFLP